MKVRIIAAGAGTGKTTELTRIVRESIVSGECRPYAVIGTTFTNKAASELIERVRQELFKTGKIGLAERLAESLLGTVDSVCAKLLGRFAFEAGILPRIGIIADTDAATLLSSAVEDSCSLKEIQKIGRIGERLSQNLEIPLRWKMQVGEIATKARENAISPNQLGAMAAQSCNEFLSCFAGPAPDGAAINQALAYAISTAIRKISVLQDLTKKTNEYVGFLRHCESELADERLTWAQWVKLTKETPAKASLAEAQPVLCAAQRYDQHPQLRKDIESTLSRSLSSPPGRCNDIRNARKNGGCSTSSTSNSARLPCWNSPRWRTSSRKSLTSSWWTSSRILTRFSSRCFFGWRN